MVAVIGCGAVELWRDMTNDRGHPPTPNLNPAMPARGELVELGGRIDRPSRQFQGAPRPVPGTKAAKARADGQGRIAGHLSSLT